MIEKITNAIVVCCSCIVTLLILNLGIKEETVTKDIVAGINPIISTKSSMSYQEPLTVILQQEEEKGKEEPKETGNDVTIEKQKVQDIIQQSKEPGIIIEDEVVTKTEQTSIDIVPTEYNGFTTIGKIEIPKTGVNIPVLDQVTVKGMENAPCLLYSTGNLNQDGNHLIVGHNYRNGTIFSDNKNLTLGDKVYVTTLDEKKVEYTIYNKFVTTAEDVSYIKRDTNGKPELTLSCCTDDDEYRIILLANVEG